MSWGQACTVLALVGGGLWFLHKRYPWMIHDIRFICAIIPTLQVSKIGVHLVDLFEAAVSKYSENIFLIFQDSKFTYREAGDRCNQVANAALKLGLKRGEDVAILIYNEPEFIWTFYGLIKIGVRPALLNHNLRSKALLHCFKVSTAKVLIVGKGHELLEAVKDISEELAAEGVVVYVQGTNQNELPGGFKSFADYVDAADCDPIDPSIRKGISIKEPMCYIYTSGTTGLPKGAVINSFRALMMGAVLIIGGVKAGDVIYTPLPLYHSAAVCLTLTGTFLSGATLLLGRKFSASAHWDECRKHNVTVIQYIGELCRYLIAKPKTPNDKNNSVRLAFGNGLRMDIWEEFKNRFDIDKIMEFYGATEGNCAFLNPTNHIGAVGRTSPFMKLMIPSYLIKFDVAEDKPIRDSNGRCIACKPGEVGLCVTGISRTTPYDGYKDNREMTNKKVITDVFKPGDRFFNTGDLFLEDRFGYLYFQDRTGDTFRWKGENVSTIEVGNTLTAVDFIEDANVYGVAVAGQDGRAGMATVTLAEGQTMTVSNLQALYSQCADHLPAYAQPKFIRVVPEMKVTVTFKQLKVDLVKQGFDPSLCSDDLFYADAKTKTFAPLTKEVHINIVEGSMKF